MQTWLVHMRQPRRLLRDLGLPGFLSFQLIAGGNALAALVHPLFLAGLIYSVSSGVPLWRGDNASSAVLAAVYGAIVVIGYQLLVAPYAWEKTEHGLAKSSRLAVNMTRSLVELERYLSSLKRASKLPVLKGAATYTAANRRPRPRVAA